MCKNNKGFSLVELFAMILITTIIIIPLMQSLVSNIKISDVLMKRRSATSIASGSIYSLDKMDFVDILSLVNSANGSFDYYIDLNLDTCNTLAAPSDQNLCSILFNTVWNNLSLTSAEYRIFIYDYYLPQTYYDSLTTDLTIPIAVRNEIALLIPDGVNTSTTLLRVTVWIEYHNDPVSTLTLSGLIYDE